jgi:hypothetical protein
MFMWMSSVPVSAPPPYLVSQMEVDLVADPLGWTGTLVGDITGTIEILELPATFTGMMPIEHFNEEFTITMTDRTVIKGVETGTFNLATFTAVANGEITEVSSGKWRWLVGYQIHLTGVADLTVDPWHFSAEIRFMEMP